MRQVAHAVLRAEGQERAEVTLLFCDVETMRALNRTYRSEDAPTDVLAFPQQGGPAGERLLGDVVVCVPVAQEQAERSGWGLEEELALLTIHGLLHLLGYDDTSPAQRRRMQRREDELFQALFHQPVRRWAEEP